MLFNRKTVTPEPVEVASRLRSIQVTPERAVLLLAHVTVDADGLETGVLEDEPMDVEVAGETFPAFWQLLTERRDTDEGKDFWTIREERVSEWLRQRESPPPPDTKDAS